MLGTNLSREQGLPRELQPPLGMLLESYVELMDHYGQQNRQSKLKPFWLPVRWTEKGMAVEQVRDAS